MNWRVVGTFLVLLSCQRVVASTIYGVIPEQKLIAVATDPDVVWSIDDYVCLLKNWNKIACGDVAKVGKKGIIIYITVQYAPYQKGDEVELLKVEVVTKTRNLTFGMNYLFPTAHVQQLFSPHFSYGLMANVLLMNKDGESVIGIGLMATLNYYTWPFRGLWVCGGLGLHLANTQIGSDRDTRAGRGHLTAFTTVGYRFRAEWGLNMGIAAGMQYFPDNKIGTFTLLGSGFQPLATLDIGLTF